MEICVKFLDAADADIVEIPDKTLGSNRFSGLKRILL